MVILEDSKSMGQLKILASGRSVNAQANARGKLFEHLMADVLRQFGYEIDRIPSVNYAGMELDIEGRSSATNIPVYVECKFYDTEIDSPKMQAFLGKYTVRWRRDKRCQGLFVANPGVNSHAKGFYRDNLQDASDMTVRLIEGDAILDAIFKSRVVCSPERILAVIPATTGKPGDWFLAFTDRGYFWILLIIPPGAAIPKMIAVLDSTGQWISDEATLEYIRSLQPDLFSFDLVVPPKSGTEPRVAQGHDIEEIVEVRGSSSCFEYQFPAAPEFLVGRNEALHELDKLVSEILARHTSARGILFEANSGLGKSSVVLSCVSRLRASGHFAMSIDCRSASSSQFILRIVSHVLTTFGTFNGLIDSDQDSSVSGVDNAARKLIAVGRALESSQRLLIVFFDQFENLFFLPEALRPIRDVFLKVCDAQTNILLGFSWKTDLFGLTTDFPYQMRDAITGSSKRVPLEPFSEVETADLLRRLSQELHSKLRKDLVFFLSEFSQGYPWLLKKLCAHVKLQREAGVAQADIANSLLNVEQLFQEDLRGLSPQQEDALQRIAKASPISISELGDELKPEVLQSLVNARLVIRVGSKIDIYWDIFKDYLNSGRVPIQDNYILRIQVGSVLKAMKLLLDFGPNVEARAFQSKAGLSTKSFYNILKDMRLLGIAKLEDGSVKSLVTRAKEDEAFEPAMRSHLKDRLRRNRLIWKIIERLETDIAISLDAIAQILAESCPYVSAEVATWRTYSRVFADWMDFADLAVLDAKQSQLMRYRPGSEVRQRNIVAGKRRGVAPSMPIIQYSPVVEVCKRIVAALQTGGRVNYEARSQSRSLRWKISGSLSGRRAQLP